jgi:hypothetical protein
VAHLTANDIRRLAEALDGDRGRVVSIVQRDGRLHRIGRDERPADGEQALFTVETKDAKPGRRGLEHIILRPRIKDPRDRTKGIEDVIDVFDALFWTEAAVSKFVLPYYLRFHTPAEVNELWLAFLEEASDSRPLTETVLAFGHLPYSEPQLIEPEGENMVLLIPEAPEKEGGAGGISITTASAFLASLRR